MQPKPQDCERADGHDSAVTMEHNLRFLAEAGAILSSSLDYNTTLQKFAQLVVPRFADWCVIDMIGDDGALRRVATTHSDPQKAELALSLDRRRPPSPRLDMGPTRVMRTGTSEFINEISDDVLRSVAADNEHYEILRGLGLRSYLCVPLIARGQSIGTITLVQAESGRRYDSADVSIAEQLAGLAALAVDNARLYALAQQEIAERRSADAARQEGERLLATTLRSIGDAVIATDAAGNISFMNNVAEELTGWSEAEAIGKPSRTVFRILNEQTRREAPSPIDRVLAEGIVVGLANHTVVVATDGREYPIEDSGAPIKDQDGRLLGVVLVFHDVTENRRREQAVRDSADRLRQSETRLRLLVDQSPLSIQVLRPDGYTVRVNRAWEKLWGVTLEDIRDYNMLQDKQLADKGIMPYIRRAFAGEAVVIPRVLYDPDETLAARSRRANPRRWTQAIMYPVKDEDGSIREIVLIHEDVTEETEAQEALIRSEARFGAFVERASDAIFLSDEEGRQEAVNSSACTMLGFTREELLKKRFADLLPAEDAPRLARVRDLLRADRDRVDIAEWQLVKADGACIPVEMSMNILPDGRWAAIVRDVSERKEAERNRAHLAAIVASSSDAIVSKDLNGIVTSWNAAAERIYGYTAQEMIGKSKAVVIPPELPDELATILGKIRAGERIEHYDTIRRRKDGSIIHVSLSVAPVRNAAGEIIGASTIGRDITERVQYLNEIESLNARLQRSIQETHHRVKNNLQIISALVEVQTDKAHTTVPVAAMHRIGQHTRSLAAIHDLMTQQVKVDANADAISTRAAMDRLLPLLQGTTGGRKIRYRVDDVRVPVKVGASLALLVSEIVSNSVKHGSGDIGLRLTVDADLMRLEVTDEGPGFPPGFDWQTAANTGLGLVESAGRYDLGGEIVYANRPGGGAQVTVTCSLARLHAA